MSNIKDRIKRIKPYFQEMQVVKDDDGDIIYVSVCFPANWIIDDETEKKFNVSVTRDGNGYFLFCADIEEGFDMVFDAIDYNINKMRSALERAKLLRMKIDELQTIFGDESISLEMLKTLEFSYKGKKKKTIAPPVIEKPMEVENAEPMEEVEGGDE